MELGYHDFYKHFKFQPPIPRDLKCNFFFAKNLYFFLKYLYLLYRFCYTMIGDDNGI